MVFEHIREARQLVWKEEEPRPSSWKVKEVIEAGQFRVWGNLGTRASQGIMGVARKSDRQGPWPVVSFKKTTRIIATIFEQLAWLEEDAGS